MVDVVVTNSRVNLKDFTVVNSVAALAKQPKIGVLVYNKSQDSASTIIQVLETIEYDSLYYICAENDVQDEIKVLVAGLGGNVVEDGFYMESYESLKSLVSSGKGLELFGASSINVLENFKKQVDSGKTEFAGAYLNVVSEAAKKTIADREQVSKELQRSSEAALALFSGATNELSESARNQQKAQQTIIDLRDSIEQGGIGSAGAIHSYPQVDYTIKKRAIVIKEVGYVPFLHSFVLGMHYYLRNRKNLKTRTIVLLSPGGLNELIYEWPTSGEIKLKHSESWNMITANNYQSRRNYSGDVIYVTHPTASVLDQLFSSTEYDSFVVLDRTLNTVNPMVRPVRGSTYMKVFHAVQSERIALKFTAIKKSAMFTSVVQVTGALFSIPFLDDYGHNTNKIMRRQRYEEACRGMYDKITKEMY